MTETPTTSRGRLTYIVGRLLATTTRQPAGAPLLDRCCGHVHDDRPALDGRRYKGWAVLLGGWRGNLAIVVGWLEPWPRVIYGHASLGALADQLDTETDAEAGGYQPGRAEP